MSPESITDIAVGIALAGLIVGFWRDVRGDMRELTNRVDDLTQRVNNLAERVARIEGVIEGVLGSRNPPPRS